eukprot:scaffold63_cov306-Pinguiococcus_pyrenoidosus.AAC.81
MTGLRRSQCRVFSRVRGSACLRYLRSAILAKFHLPSPLGPAGSGIPCLGRHLSEPGPEPPSLVMIVSQIGVS